MEDLLEIEIPVKENCDVKEIVCYIKNISPMPINTHHCLIYFDDDYDKFYVYEINTNEIYLIEN